MWRSLINWCRSGWFLINRKAVKANISLL
jgi:hypothetical protein